MFPSAGLAEPIHQMPAMRDKLRFLSLCKLAAIQRRSQARLNSESNKTHYYKLLL